MADKATLTTVVLYEDDHGKRVSERHLRVTVFQESSSKTIEALDPLLRSAYGLSSGSHLRSRREDWNVRERRVRFTIGELTKPRHFVVEFADSLPEWSECDW